MSLQNLLEIGSLDQAEPRRADIQRLLGAAERNLNDAGVTEISEENRFDAAYKCVMQCALASLLANGYKPAMDKPGHHQMAIQSLPTTIGLDTTTMIELDEMRKIRNCDDYEGRPVSSNAVEDAQTHAKALLAGVRAWLGEHHPELV